MSRKIVLVGKSCSGKSTIAKELEKYGLTAQISTTTRPKRDYEKQGIDYHFISDAEFDNKNANGEFIETDSFNNWQYGLTHDDFNKADVLILTPRGLQKYLDILPKEKFLIIYIETSIELRCKRIDYRGDKHDDINRRWVADEIDFMHWEQWGALWDMKISLQSENVIPNLIQILTQNKKIEL